MRLLFLFLLRLSPIRFFSFLCWCNSLWPLPLVISSMWLLLSGCVLYRLAIILYAFVCVLVVCLVLSCVLWIECALTYFVCIAVSVIFIFLLLLYICTTEIFFTSWTSAETFRSLVVCCARICEVSSFVYNTVEETESEEVNEKEEKKKLNRNR